MPFLRRSLFYSTAVAALMATGGGGGGATFADLLLDGETDGFAIDATDVSATPAYEGAPYAGYVSVIDTGTPANDLSNVALDSSNLTNSGTSPKMVLWNSSPYVRWTPHNYILQSQTLNTTWSSSSGSVFADTAVAPDGTTTADTFTGVDSSSVRVQTGLSGTANFAHTYSFYLKYNDRQWVMLQFDDGVTTDRCRAWFDVQNGVTGSTATTGSATVVGSSITSVGNGWYRCAVTGILTAAIARVLFLTPTADASAGAIAGSVDAWGAQLVRGYNANPYLVTTSAARIGIPQEYDTAASKFGILVEPASTNLKPNSENFSTWSLDKVTISSDATTAPDGSLADKIVETATSGVHEVYDSFTGGTPTTWSIFAKAAERSWMCLSAYDGTERKTYFDLTNGVVGTNFAGNTATITNVGNGWYRCSVERAVAGTYFIIGIASADNTNSYAGDGTSGLYIWGTQVETSAIATSYIPTLGSTVTRAKDVIKATDNSHPLSATTYSLYAKAKSLKFNDTGVIQFGDGTVTNDTALYEKDSTHLNIYTSGDVDANAGSFAVGTTYKVAGRWLSNDTRGAVDGALGTQDTGTTPDAGCTRVSLALSGGEGTTGGPIRIYEAVMLPRAYSDTELQVKTS